VEFAPAPSTDDWLSAAIGEADTNFIDSQEQSDSSRPSSCDDMHESESDDDNSSFFDATQTLEDLLWPAEVLHNPEGLALPLPRHRRQVHYPQTPNCDNMRINDDQVLQGRSREEGSAPPLPGSSSTGGENGLMGSPGGSWPAEIAVGAPVGIGAVGAGGSPQGSGQALGASGWPSSGQTFGEGWAPAARQDHREHCSFYQEDGGMVRPIPTPADMRATSSKGGDGVEQRRGNLAELNLGDDSEEDMDLDMEEIDPQSMRWRFHNETWSHAHFTYDPKPRPFRGQRGPVKHYHSMPTFMHLFDLFWSYQTLRSIVRETNRYATHEVDDNGKPRGGEKWETLTVPGLKAFLGVSILMGMKKQPNLRTYWQKVGSFFHCPLISQSFIRERFMAIRKCLHITNPASYANVDRGDVGFDKIRQVRWLVDKIRDACKAVWSLGKYLTIDEMMIRYKGSYSPIWQYMPNKPQKWGLKVWCLADAVSKYVYNFAIYCGKTVENV
jgi:hypothetical protein